MLTGTLPILNIELVRMTNLIVKIISKECIKPSSPTPQHLRTHKLSLLDQYIPSIYIPLLLFYPPHPNSNNDLNVSQRSQLLKKSLSETLTDFYPLAGRVKDVVSVDCNDKGACFIEAKVDSINLSEFLDIPDVSQLGQFLPSDAGYIEAIAGAHLAMVQVTNFACGGFVVGVFVSHMVVDGTALTAFLKAWAARFRKAPESHKLKPNFDAPHVFVQNDAFPKEASLMSFWIPFLRMGTCASRRFVFDAVAIAELKAKASANSASSIIVKNPTRVEVVTALIWKCVMAASTFNMKSNDNGQGKKRSALITQAVNLRRRAVPPFSENCMGNYLSCAAAVSGSSNTQEVELGSLISRMREAIYKFDGSFVKSLQGDGGLASICKLSNDMRDTSSHAASDGGLDYINFSSWCNFGLYDVDFGWGKPMWMSCVGASKVVQTVFMNSVLLTDTRSRDGVEAWIYLDEQVMAILENDAGFLSFASIDPSPLKLGNYVSHP